MQEDHDVLIIFPIPLCIGLIVDGILPRQTAGNFFSNDTFSFRPL